MQVYFVFGQLDCFLEKPSVDVCPWIYVKDHKLRFPNGKAQCVMIRGYGHIGFVCETDDGWLAEADVGQMFYGLPGAYPTAEDAMRAVAAKHEEVRLQDRARVRFEKTAREMAQDAGVTIEQARAKMLSWGISPEGFHAK